MGNLSRALVLGAAVLLATGPAAAGPHLASRPPACDRACLIALADRYMDAMVAKAPAGLPWAGRVRFSENSVPMMVGDGLWATISGHSPDAIRAADPQTGQVAWIGTVEEHGQPAFFALRLKAEGGKIAEAETVVRRKGGPPQFGDAAAFHPDPAFGRATSAADRVSRDRLASLVEGYLDTLQAGDGRVLARFAPDCARTDNGVATTDGATAEGGVQGCQAQFKAKVFKPVSRVRGRALPVVDASTGVVVATGFLDLPARMPKAAPGQGLAWTANYPYSIGFIAAFKIERGRILRIDSTSGALPYRMPSQWTDDRPR